MKNGIRLAVFTVMDADLKVLLSTEKDPRLPTADVLEGGAFEEIVPRVLATVTGLHESVCASALLPEQLYTFGNRHDPKRAVTVTYYALVQPTLASVVSALGVFKWVSVESLWNKDGLPIAEAEVAESGGLNAYGLPDWFDNVVLKLAAERVRGKFDYAPIAFQLVPPTFTVAELRSVHEAVKGHVFDPRNFNRRFRRMLTDRTIQQASGHRVTAGKSAKVYEFRRKP